MDRARKSAGLIADILLGVALPFYSGRRATLSLKNIVVGAGIGRLAAIRMRSRLHIRARSEHRITLLGSAHELGEVLAGINVSHNATRLLRCGLGPALHVHAVEPTASSFDSTTRASTLDRPLVPNMGRGLRDHSAPHDQVNGADYHTILHRLACSLPDVRPSRRHCMRHAARPVVAGVPSVTLASGEVFYADLIVCADGMESTLQKDVTGLDHRDTPVGDPGYRAVVSAGPIFEDPELGPLVEIPETIV